MDKTEAVNAIKAIVADTGSVRHAKDQTATVYEYKTGRIALHYSRYATVKVVAEWGDPCKNGYNRLHFRSVVSVYDEDTDNLLAVGEPGDYTEVWQRLENYYDPALNDILVYDGFTTRLTYYIENTLYHAGDRDCWGLRKGEKRQIVNGRTGQPSWHLGVVGPDGTEYAIHEIRHKLGEYADGAAPPELEGYTFKYLPWCRTGEGKERELGHARRGSFWPDATDEELCSDDLADRLVARAPEVLAKAKALIESFGLTW